MWAAWAACAASLSQPPAQGAHLDYAGHGAARTLSSWCRRRGLLQEKGPCPETCQGTPTPRGHP